jgi:predicted ribosomally synthesized peptide with SipW-like signal peptide
MARHALRITILLGVLITLVGGTGIFAVFSDRATAGENSVTTGERPRAADLKLAAASPEEAGVMCAPATTQWADDTETAQFTAGSLQPGQGLAPAYLCLMNAGSARLVVHASAIDLVDADIACTGDEGAAGDATCGLDPNEVPQAGELSAGLRITIDRVDCTDPTQSVGAESSSNMLDQFSSMFIYLAPGAAGAPLAPDEIACLRLQASYPTPASEDVAQRAQTDRATWRFAFDAEAS